MSDFGEIILQTIPQMHFLGKIILFSFIGIMAAEIIFKRLPKFTKIIAKPIKPLTRSCRLPEEIGTILMSSMFVSNTATNTVLISRHKDGIINENQVVVAAILNTIPAYARRLLMFVLPAFVPLFGWTFFLGIVFCYGLVMAVKIIFCIVYGRIVSSKEKPANKEQTGKAEARATVRIPEKRDWRLLVKEIKHFSKKPLKMFFKISILLLITTFLAFFLINAGLLEKIAVPLLQPLIEILSLPESFAAPLMVFSTGSVVAGGSVFKNLITQGVISWQEAFIGILFGILVSQPAIVFQHVVPPHVAVFGRKLAFKIIGISLIIVLVVRTTTFLIFKSILL